MPFEREREGVADFRADKTIVESLRELKRTQPAVSKIYGSYHLFGKVYGKRPTEFSSERAVESGGVVSWWMGS